MRLVKCQPFCVSVASRVSRFTYDNALCNPDATLVRVTHEAHPLRGCCVTLRQVRDQGGESFLVIERPDGQVQQIPRSWTDLAVPEPATPGARFTPRQLLALRRWLDTPRGVRRRAGGEEVVSSAKNGEGSGGNDDEGTNNSSPSEGGVGPVDACAAAAAGGAAGGVGAAEEGAGRGGSPATGRSRRSRP